MNRTWMRTIAEAASLKRRGRGRGVGGLILAAAGDPLSIRAARGSLFSTVRQVLGGEPRAIAIEEDAIVLVIALSDFVEIMETRPANLKERLEESGIRRARATRSPG